MCGLCECAEFICFYLGAPRLFLLTFTHTDCDSAERADTLFFDLLVFVVLSCFRDCSSGFMLIFNVANDIQSSLPLTCFHVKLGAISSVFTLSLNHFRCIISDP